MFDVYVSVAYIGPKSRTERPRKTKIGTEVAHVTRDSDTTFKVQRSKVNLQGRGHIVAASRTACYCNKDDGNDDGDVWNSVTCGYHFSMIPVRSAWLNVATLCDFYKPATIPAAQSNDRQI